MNKIITAEYSNPGERIAGDYVNAFLKDVRILSPEGIDYIRELEAIANFKVNYAKRKNLDMAGIIQGENEIGLAVKLYNLIETKGSCN